MVGMQRSKARVRQPCLNRLGIAHTGEELKEIHAPDVWGFLSSMQVRVPECQHAEGMRRTPVEG